MFRVALTLLAACVLTGTGLAQIGVVLGSGPVGTPNARDTLRTWIGGGIVPGPDGSFGGLRREINWDDVPNSFADPNNLPSDFFNVNSPRGLAFSTPGTGFLISSHAGDLTPILFGFPNDFQTFSSQRLFTALNSNITDVFFFAPGTDIPATTPAFGVVFTGVEVVNQTLVEYFDRNNNLFAYATAPPSGSHNGWSFVGGIFRAPSVEEIFRVRITSGVNTIVSNGQYGSSTNFDAVVMDDFIYGEPHAVPEPTTLVLTGTGCVGLAAVCYRQHRRARRRKVRSR